MNLESQVCSVAASQRLRELGVKQESLFWWEFRWPDNVTPFDDGWRLVDRGEASNSLKHTVAAFTVAELGEMFGSYNLPFYHDGEWKSDGYYNLPDGRERIIEETEANARAAELVYLLENKMITL